MSFFFYSIDQYTYRSDVNLYIGGETLLSEEGTTQGDPLAMPMYALGTIPLINALSDDHIKQVWYADDATACGRLMDVRFLSVLILVIFLIHLRPV